MSDILLETGHDLPLVSLAIGLHRGAAVDGPKVQGLTRFTFAALKRGAGSYTASQVEERLDSIGGRVGFDVHTSNITVHAQVLRRNLAPFVDLLGTLLSSPTFQSRELKHLRDETLADLLEARDHDRALAERAFRRALFGNHAYGRPASGTVSSTRFSESDIRRCFQGHVSRRDAVLGFAGDIERREALRVAEQIRSALPDRKPADQTIGEPHKRHGRHLVFVDKPSRTQLQIIIGTLGTSAHDADHSALSLATSAFGGTFTARLMNEIRSKRGWSYGANARLPIEQTRHGFSMWTFPGADHAPDCLTLELALLNDWVLRGITAKELQAMKQYLVRSFAFERDTPQKRLGLAMDVKLLKLPKDYYAKYIERISSVTVSSANEAIRRRIDPKNLVVAVVGTKDKHLAQIERAIGLLDSTTIVRYDDPTF